MELVGYLSNGYPSLDKSLERAKLYFQGGVDVLQIDFPANDPYLEGEMIAKRMRSALQYCNDWNAYMKNISAIHKALPDMNIFLLIYDYTVKEIGAERFIDFCLKEELRNVTYIGDNHPEIKQMLMHGGIKISCYVQFHMDPGEIENALNSNGFVYLQSRSQLPSKELPFQTLKGCVSFLRRELAPDRKIYTGVGLKTPQDVKLAEEAGCDGAFVGSSIMQTEDSPQKLLRTIQIFKQACNGVNSL